MPIRCSPIPVDPLAQNRLGDDIDDAEKSDHVSQSAAPPTTVGTAPSELPAAGQSSKNARARVPR